MESNKTGASNNGEVVYDDKAIMSLLFEWRNVAYEHADPSANSRYCQGAGMLALQRRLESEHGVRVGYRSDDCGWLNAVPLGFEVGNAPRVWKVSASPGMIDDQGNTILDDQGNEIGYEIEIPVTEVMPYADAVSRGLIADGDKPAIEFGGAARMVSVQVGTEKRWIGPPREPSGV